ncbi:WD40 repeat protein [Breznakibacter xylanolyticus]|uniref:WD40 repeat protein n=1 Tax=Breznakibacter xylanolyticus TaxID=990 RepID=A0A2W7NJD3_9BACT|nr:PD40 domain-containing protein [Breznakibacter xylanolyticus]PZX16824.1 WD40 repeat protein [Breznakibacter xylanolyticus]
MSRLYVIVSFFLVLASCQRPHHVRQMETLPPIYPDYVDVTIPENIAPLNFLMRGAPERMEVYIHGNHGAMTVRGRSAIAMPLKRWRQLLADHRGDSLTVEVTARVEGEWQQYRSFVWHVAPDPVDAYLTYRLIEPGYEVWNQIQLIQRDVTSFDERVIADNQLTEGRCMNCHISGKGDASLTMFHVRGQGGGTILNRDGRLRKLALRTDSMMSAGVYGDVHPSGRFGVFSSNVVIPAFHAYGSERLEVYDDGSDLVVADFDNHTILRPGHLNGEVSLETFPVFSPDGRFIYYCVASAVELPEQLRDLQYHLCRVTFDAESGAVGTDVDTVWHAGSNSGSASHPKVSPDGRYLLFTKAAYGTFPIWHREAELQLIDLQTGMVDSLLHVNGPNSDTYHSWSRNSRWFVFASKRDDGIYGKPYFCYVDGQGKAHKPFVLPQRHPSKYDVMLKSFNLPELMSTPVPFDAMDVAHLFRRGEAERFE